MSAVLAVSRAPLPELHATFAPVLKAVEAAARAAGRHLRCPHDRADLAADAALRAWQKFLRFVTEGARPDPAGLARRAVAAARRHLRRQTAPGLC
jgi:hypothetical protein